MYIFFLIIHVICAGIWIGLAPAMIVMSRLLKKAQANPNGKISELWVIRAMMMLGLVMGNVGSIGILISGGAIAGIGHWGWFDFGNHPTVAIKQCVYLLLLILGMAVMMPLSKKAKKLLGEEMSGSYSGPGASPELRALVERIGGVGTIMGLLVLINIILGIWTNKGVWF